MLKEIWCEEFKKNGVTRPPIKFHKGLNAVVGNESGTNSIGKSTFLMILDFVFGGDDYIKKSKEVHRNVDPHTIYFTFEFDGDFYYFSRNTDDPSKIGICDDQRKQIEVITLNSYLELLKEKYDLTEYKQTFRGTVGRFIRVDRRETLDEGRPFSSAKKETDADSLISILKCYGEYEEVEELEKQAKDAKDREDVFKAGQKYKYIPSVKNQTEYAKNLERIEILEVSVQELAERTSMGLLDLSSMEAEELRELKKKASSFRRQRTNLQAQLDQIEKSKDELKKTFQKDYAELQAFFPDLNVERLDQIEDFHRTILRILRKEISDSADNLQAMIDLATQEIDKLEKEQRNIAKNDNLAKAILDKYAALRRELQTLVDANKAYDKKNALHEDNESKADKLDRYIVERMSLIEHRLNVQMDEMNSSLYSFEMEPPRLHVESSKKYTFYTPDDGGTGIRYKGLILFDLAAMRTSKLPFIVHDSVLLLQIENEVIEKILDLYMEEQEKQIFITFDKVSTEHEREVLDKVEVLHLSRGGNELFGRAWNKKKKTEATEESAKS